ncbi:MAG: serine hydrolase [Acidobacteriota bacterium]|nr:serine hydrolase [Acidobacteriota bacterium]
MAQQVLATTGVPSASLAVVKDGKIAYLQAYGQARLDPRTPATPAMRYSIGSISKQFTAAAILMLAEEGKLSLDDPVSKYASGLTRGNEVTIRELLAHHLRLSGFLAAGLRSAFDAAADLRRTDHGPLGPQAAGLRSRDEVVVQQYELRDCRRYRGKSKRDATVVLTGAAGLHSVGHEECHRHE